MSDHHHNHNHNHHRRQRRLQTMEINPSNAIISSLREKAGADQGDKTVKDLIWLLYDVRF